MRGTKYSAKDKTVQKSGRDGLKEINLHSHESVSISSREIECAIHKASDSANCQEIRRQGSSAVNGKGKRPERVAAYGNKSCADSMADGRNEGFQQPEMGGGRYDNFRHLGIALDDSENRTQNADMAGGCNIALKTADSSEEEGKGGNRKFAAGIRYKEPNNLVGTAAWRMERQQHENGVRHELKYDALCPSAGPEESSGSQKDEEAACIRENAPDGCMAAQDADDRLFHERSSISIQQTVPRYSGMADSRKHTGRGRKKQRCRKRRFHWRDEQDIFPGKNRAGVYGTEKGAENGSSAVLDMDRYSGMPDRRDTDSGSVSSDEKLQTDSVRKTPHEKKHKLFLSSDEQTGMETEGNIKSSDTAGTGSEHADGRHQKKASGNGTLKDTVGRKGADAENAVWPAGSEKSSQKHGQEENGRKKNISRLYFEEESSGMVRGTGMGIVKHTARFVCHTVYESGSVGMDNEDVSRTGLEKMDSGRRIRAAVSRPRHIICSRSSRAAGRILRKDSDRIGLQPEKTGKAVGMDTGRETRSDMDGRPGENAENAASKKRKSIHRRQQKKSRYQLETRTAIWKAGQSEAGVAKSDASGNVLPAAGRKRDTVFVFWGRRKNMRWMLAAIFLLFLTGMSMLTSCAALFQGTSGIAGTTYPGRDEDIRCVETRYQELENALDGQVNNIEDAHPGYDEYRYQIDEISHDPYRLASYLTVICPGYTYIQAEGMLQEILECQYRLTVEEQTETRTDPDTGELMEWRVLCISLTNRGLDAVAHDQFTEDQERLYQAYNLTHGCRDGLFGETEENGEPNADITDVGVPAVPGGALSDQRFANMLQEAEKYLGYPYVWGGSSPQTSFDCSGFVSWVINNCGNGWNIGRQTAEGLRGCCSYVSPEDARPGDLIFFQGTYNTPGASHVGIYVGSNRMIHCGSPIQYAELGAYWNLHFLSYGRLP